ncbi:MAG: hypothetical protein HQ567_22705 [Candidatus Nealsonbacteria bacterium]|nr:hypothetical protein [Candidatus Nealsonbacteria bacterium]
MTHQSRKVSFSRRRCISLAGASVCAAFLGNPRSGLAEDEEDEDRDELPTDHESLPDSYFTDVESRPPTDWSELYFDRQKKEIREVRVVFYKEEQIPFTLHKRQPLLVANGEGFDAVIRDPVQLRLIAKSLQFQLCIACAPTSMWGGVDLTLGAVHVIAPPRHVLIGITTAGFVLGTRHYVTPRTFFSWGLAKTLDEALVKQGKPRMSASVFDNLSGEMRVRRAKAMYEHSRKMLSQPAAETKPGHD